MFRQILQGVVVFAAASPLGKIPGPFPTAGARQSFPRSSWLVSLSEKHISRLRFKSCFGECSAVEEHQTQETLKMQPAQ
ncbi:UNVERIFIED_CONTAM: hypothetical protein K2H54_063338, partial [Gekko kuhli]